MKHTLAASFFLASLSVAVQAGEPTGTTESAEPTGEWIASAENIAGRVDELLAYGRANGDDDGRLADAVGVFKERAAVKKVPPVWTKKTSWIEGKGEDRVFFGVGVFSGPTSNRTLAVMVAENRARVEIAKLQKVSIVRKSEANGWRSVSITTSATMENVVIVDWYTSGNTYYALAAWSRKIVVEPTAPWVP